MTLDFIESRQEKINRSLIESLTNAFTTNEARITSSALNDNNNLKVVKK